MHLLRHRDLDHRDLVHHSVHDLVFLQLLQNLDHLNGTDHLKMVHLFRCVVEIVNPNQMYQRHRQDVEKMDALQILDEQNLDEVLTFLDEVRHFLVNLADVQVDVEPCHLLNHLSKRDCYLDEVDEELRHL
jgi:hypothetical protein